VEVPGSCLAAVERALDVIARKTPDINAFAFLDPERARREAESGAHASGELACTPVGVKDVIDVAGMPTRAGSEVLPSRPADHDATVITRLRQAGAVVIGKTHTQEFAYGVVTPQVANPRAPGHIAGGSSGGSAAAVAAGMVPLAIGTDTAGSVRIPAALCGVVGLKPRSRQVPLDGVVPLAPSFDSCGPIAASVHEVRRAFEVMAARPLPMDDGSAAGLRLGVPSSTTLGAMDDTVCDVFDYAVERLTDQLGFEFHPVEMTPFEEWIPPRAVVQMTEALAVHEDAGWWPDRRDQYGEEVAENLERGRRFSAIEFLRAERTLNHLVAELGEVVGSVDALVLPTTPIPAPTRAEVNATEPGSPRRPVVNALTRLCAPANIADLAALSVPAGTTGDGRPIGLQFVAPDEVVVLRLGRMWESPV